MPTAEEAAELKIHTIHELNPPGTRSHSLIKSDIRGTTVQLILLNFQFLGKQNSTRKKDWASAAAAEHIGRPFPFNGGRLWNACKASHSTFPSKEGGESYLI